VRRGFRMYNSASRRGVSWVALKRRGSARRSIGGEDRFIRMKKFNILVTGNDGKKFYQKCES
jgi:hypothetical protein